MTKEQEDKVMEVIEELTVWESRIGQLRGMLVNMIASPVPRKRPTKEDRVQALIDDCLRRGARKKVKQAK